MNPETITRVKKIEWLWREQPILVRILWGPEDPSMKIHKSSFMSLWDILPCMYYTLRRIVSLHCSQSSQTILCWTSVRCTDQHSRLWPWCILVTCFQCTVTSTAQWAICFWECILYDRLKCFSQSCIQTTLKSFTLKVTNSGKSSNLTALGQSCNLLTCWYLSWWP